jgi:ketosteroid isomerase-like protein
MSGKEELIKCSKDIINALKANDLDALRDLYMPDFMGVSARGEQETLEMILEVYQPGSATLKTFNIHEQQAEVFGEIGIITGSGYISGFYGKYKWEHNLRYTDIYLYRDGRWRCYRSQATETE